MRNTWRNNLRPASWRGVAFEVSGDEAEFGRNVVVHEFVQRDKPFVEDLGRKTRRLRIEAWICASPDNGFNPWPQRDALIAAVEEGGVGTLVHPFYGSLRGHISGVQVKQTSSERGGFIGLSMEFIEAGELGFRVTEVVADTASEVNDSAQAVYEDAQAEFAQSFSIDGAAGFVGDDVFAGVRQFLAEVQAAGALLSADSQFAAAALGLRDTLRRPLALADSIVHLVREVQRPQILRTFSRPSIPTVNTPARDRQRGNTRALVHLVRIAAVATFAQRTADLASLSDRYAAASTRLGATPQLITRSEMDTLRQEVASSVTAVLHDLSDQQAYPTTRAALVRLRTAAIQHLTAEGEHLARTFVTSCCDGTGWWNPMPTLVLAYRHYGVLADDVINTRNEIGNPLFIPPNAGVELLHEVTA